MSKLDDLLVALSDDSPWSMKAAEVLSIPNSEIRDLLMEYIRRHERAQWFAPNVTAPAYKHVLVVYKYNGTILNERGYIDDDGDWQTLVHVKWRDVYEGPQFMCIPDGSEVIAWRWHPVYEEGK